MFDIPIQNNVRAGVDLNQLMNGQINGNQQNAASTTQPMPQQQYTNQMNQMPQQQYANQMNQMPQQQYANQMNQMPQQQYANQMNQMPQQQYANQMNQMSQQQTGKGVVVKKGQKVKLSSPNNGRLDLIEVGLGWDLGPNGQGYDLDVEAFLLGENGKVLGDEWFVFYNQNVSPDGSVVCGIDNTSGAGFGDDESIRIQLSKVHPNVAKIVFIVTINEALERGYNFSNVSNAYVRIVDKITNQELIRFNLTEYYATVCSMVVGELYKHNGEWKFNAVGNGTAQDLTGLCMSYGVNVIG
mgnify:CR=1 FL=1